MSGGPGDSWASWLGASSGPASLVYKEWEAWFAQQAERLARNDELVGHLGAALERSGGLARLAQKAVTAALEARGGPSSELERRVAELERQLAELKAKLG